MKIKRFLAALLCAALTLSLTGCLAQPERTAPEGTEDKFIGFLVIPYPDTGTGYLTDDFYNNPNLTAYGTEELSVSGMGNFSFDREVLFAKKDGSGNYVFPGMRKGYSLFCYTYTSKNGDHVNAVQSNMAPGEEGNQIKYTDEGEEYVTSGTIYFGPPVGAPDDWFENADGKMIWQTYRVYETADERIYTDGSGNSFGGVGGMTFTETETSTQTLDGETKGYSMSISVKLACIPRLESVTLRQFDDNDQLLQTDIITDGQVTPDMEAIKLTLAPGTAYVFATETNAMGYHTRTIHNVERNSEDGLDLTFYFLDDTGAGYPANIKMQ